MDNMRPLVTDEEGGKKRNGPILDNRLRLPDITHNQRRYGIRDCFRGVYCCLGGPMGSPIAPVGRYGTPGDRWRVWQKKWFNFGFFAETF